MLKKITFFVFCVIALSSFLLSAYNYYKSPSIVYIRSQELVDKYSGTREAMKQQDLRKERWKSNIDTLSFSLQKAISDFNAKKNTLTVVQKRESEQSLMQQQQQLQKYSQSIEEKALEEDEKIMQGILNQINSYVEQYGKSHGYDIVMGTTQSGNLLYGNKEFDVTDEVLLGLNKNYSGVK